MLLDVEPALRHASGIYSITNGLNGKIYIGSAVDFYRRYCGHLTGLRRKAHHCPHLVAAMHKYGSEHFVFRIVALVENPQHLLAIEQIYIDTLCTTDPSRGYNACPIAGSRRGSKASLLTRRQISVSLTGRAVSLETREKLSRAQKGKPRFHRKLTPEEYKALADKRRGVPLSQITRQRIQKKLIGHSVSEETRQKISLSLIGKRQTPESIEKRAAHFKKPIKQHALDGSFLQEWPSAAEASTALGINASHIRTCCRGHRKSAGGFRWLPANS